MALQNRDFHSVSMDFIISVEIVYPARCTF
nr:MAG TPA: hypothetical protein [Caudoviricetes sp.]